MASTKNRKQNVEPFAHAADLPAAYQELKAAIEAQIQLRDHGPLPLHESLAKRVHTLPYNYIWQEADDQAAAWKRIATAARRVRVALDGPRDARSWDKFVPQKEARA